jgi:hypothetical protein
VIAGHIDHVLKQFAGSAQEVSEPQGLCLASAQHAHDLGLGQGSRCRMIVQILGQHDITAQDQDLGLILIIKLKIAKL